MVHWLGLRAGSWVKPLSGFKLVFEYLGIVSWSYLALGSLERSTRERCVWWDQGGWGCPQPTLVSRTSLEEKGAKGHPGQKGAKWKEQMRTKQLGQAQISA